MEAKIEATTFLGGDVAGAGNVLPSRPGVGHGPDSEERSHRGVRARRSGVALALRQVAGPQSEQRGGVRTANRERAPEYTAVGLGCRLHGRPRGHFVVLAPLHGLVLVPPSTHCRAPERATRDSLEAAQLPSRSTCDQTIPGFGRRGNRLRSKNPSLLGQGPDSSLARWLERLLCAVTPERSVRDTQQPCRMQLVC